jgi:hypothetical protein
MDNDERWMRNDQYTNGFIIHRSAFIVSEAHVMNGGALAVRSPLDGCTDLLSYRGSVEERYAVRQDETARNEAQ